MKPKLAITGAAGRMGKRIISLAIDAQQFDIIAAIDQKSCPDIGKDAGTIAGKEAINVPICTADTAEAAKADVMIDFSLPTGADATIEYCAKNNIALVMGTTGLDDGQLANIKSASEKIPIIQATNMSVGMNTLFEMVGKLAKMLGSDYDIEITEAHHRFKKDAPSGSALTLAEKIAQSTQRNFPDCLVHGREGKDALRQKDTIGMHAIRAGDIVGQHSVIFSTIGETITLSHNAHSRDTFAAGAVRAAKWLAGKKPGLYSMTDVLGLNQ